MILALILVVMIFFAPTNWFLQLSDQHAYLTGLRVDYLIPKLYPVDLLALMGLVLGGFGEISGKFRTSAIFNRKNLLMIGVIFVFVLGQILSDLPILAAIWVLRILIYCGFAWVLSKNLPKLQKSQASKMIFWALSLNVIFQSIVGIIQFTRQSSVAGYWFFGETNLNYFANIAKVVLNGQELITAYGTTAHPNILAGLIAVFLAIVWRLFWSKKSFLITKMVFLATLTLGLIVLTLTFSVSGWLTFLSAGLVINWPQTKISKFYQKTAIWILIAAGALLALANNFLPPNSNPPLSISRRIFLAEAALKMWLNNLLTGVGLGQFTLNLEKFTAGKEVVRFLQPVHHTLGLWLTETGLIGTILAAKLRKPLGLAVAITLPSLIWDHYWMSQPNALLIFMLLPILGTLAVETSKTNKTKQKVT